MTGWSLLNWGAWTASAIFAVIILVDFLKAEKARKQLAERDHDHS